VNVGVVDFGGIVDHHCLKKFEDTKGVIRICISKKNRQHNHIKLKIE
jgi:hypothetical protein